MPVPISNTPAVNQTALPEFVEKLPDALGLHPMREAWAQVHDRLMAGGDTQRAWALALEASAAMVSDGPLLEGWGRSPTTRSAMLALADLAQASTQATPLRLALGVCALRPFSEAATGAGQVSHSDTRLDAACQALDSDSLAEREPLDAHGWLQRAATATEPQARSEALELAAAAPRLTGLWHEAPQTVVQAWPANQPAYLRFELTLRALGVAAVLESAESPIMVMRFCRDTAESAVEDTGRMLCDRLARLFLERSTTAQLAMFGPSIGRLAGWPEAEVKAAQRQLMALTRASIGLLVTDASPWSCAAISGFEQHLAASARDGELTALRSLQAAQAATPKASHAGLHMPAQDASKAPLPSATGDGKLPAHR